MLLLLLLLLPLLPLLLLLLLLPLLPLLPLLLLLLLLIIIIIIPQRAPGVRGGCASDPRAAAVRSARSPACNSSTAISSVNIINVIMC